MIDYKTKMLAVDLQAAVTQSDGEKIFELLNQITHRLGGQELPRDCPAVFHTIYLLACVIRNTPTAVTTDGPLSISATGASEPMKPPSGTPS